MSTSIKITKQEFFDYCDLNGYTCSQIGFQSDENIQWFPATKKFSETHADRLLLILYENNPEDYLYRIEFEKYINKATQEHPKWEMHKSAIEIKTKGAEKTSFGEVMKKWQT